MKKIYIVSSFRKTGTFFLRGKQVADALRDAGFDVRICRPSQLRRVHNAILLFIKFCDAQSVAAFKEKGNRVIWDLLDHELTPADTVPNVDAVIYSTTAQRRDIHRLFGESAVASLIYHHIDTRLSQCFNIAKQSAQFDLGYIGLVNNLGTYDTLEDLTVVNVDTARARQTAWMKKISRFNCHFSVRNSSSQTLYKPLAKVATAAACRSNIIVNRACAALELLGDDYPYQSDTGISSVAAAIHHCKDSFGGPVWKQGLDRMESLRSALDLGNLINEYVHLFEMLA